MDYRYIALKTDIIRSRNINERDRIQELFFQAADQINTAFNSSFESGFIITHGDEAQALIKTAAADSVFAIMEMLVETMEPVELRFGFGYGTLNTKLQKMAIGMDGEAWRNAKEAIEEARKSRQMACFRGFGPDFNQILQSLTNLLLFLHQHWTPEQLQVIRFIRTGLTQSMVAKELRVTEAAISKRLSAAGWRQYINGKKALQRLSARALEE